MRMIFVNLPVKDLEASKRFFASLGFVNNPQFTDEKAAAMMFEENITVMLLHEAYFKSFLARGEVGDTAKGTEVLIALSADSREEVDGYLAKAVAGGGKPYRPTEDHGFMYQTSFQDLDGHVFEVAWMDPAMLASGETPQVAEPA